MFEARNSRTFQAMFLFLITATICLVSMERSFAAEKVDQSNLPEWAGGWTHINPDPNGTARMWQTFTPNYSNITAVEIDILTVNTGQFDDIITVEIAKDGEILTSTEGNVEYGYDGLLRFEFTEAIQVVPGELYELKVRDTGLTRFGWRYASNTYDAGSRYVSASERPGTDWFFQTYASVEPRIIYVDDDAAGANDGSSWENAYVYLQDALADANSAEKPIEIRVAQGTYKPNQGLVAIPEFDWRTITFQLINGVTLKGGYAGLGESYPNTRDIELYQTILSGDLNGDDDPNFINNSENSYHVVTGSGTDRSAVLDGFTIAGGNANGQEMQTYDRGGGFFNDSGSYVIRDCTFTENTCLSYGAGMYLSNECQSVIQDCYIVSNYSQDDGGGLFIKNDYALYDCSPLITYCVIENNWARDGSGGIRCDDYTKPTIRNSIIAGNVSGYEGGGLSCKWQCLPKIENCTIVGNASGYGGGLYCIETDVRMVNCILWANRANYGNQIAVKLLDEEEYRTYTRLFISYCNVQGGRDSVNVDSGCGLFWSLGNIDTDPLFASPDYWADANDPNIIIKPNDPNAVWVNGDYHLKSQAGRWDPKSENWVIDDVTSLCIDAGDPNSPVGDEPDPKGDRINMGAYGGSAEASKSYTSESSQTTQGLIRDFGFKSGK